MDSLNLSTLVTTNSGTEGVQRQKHFSGAGNPQHESTTRNISHAVVITNDINSNPSNSAQSTFSKKKIRHLKKSEKPPRKKSSQSDLLSLSTNLEEKSEIEGSKQPSAGKERSKKSSQKLNLSSNSISQAGKIENNVKFAQGSSVVSSELEKNFESDSKMADRAFIKERLENQKALLHYFQYLKEMIVKPNLCLQVDVYGKLGCYYSNKSLSSYEKNYEKNTILTILYTTLNEAISLKNTMFFSSKGSPVFLDNFDEMITAAYPERDSNIEILRSQVLKSLQRSLKKDKNHLQSSVSVSENENISLFPKDPSLFLITKIKNPQDETLNEKFLFLDNIEFKKNEIQNLNRQVTDYIKDTESSLLQKVSFMNFYKSRVENYLFFLEFLKAWIPNYNIDEHIIKNATFKKDQLKIKLEDPLNKNPFLNRLNSEIEYLSSGINFEYDKGHKGTPKDVGAFINDLPHANSHLIREFIDMVSMDMKIHSAQTFNLMTFDTCMLSTSSKYPDESVRYSNYLVNFIYKTFNDIQTRYQLSHDKKPHTFTENYFHVYMFFINLGVELLKKHDYLSSVAIHTALQNTAIEWVIRNRKDLPHTFQNNLNFFRTTLNPQDNYGNLRKIIADCRADKIFHSPSINIYMKFIHHFETLSLLDTDTSHLKSLEIKNINDYFKEIRFNYETASKNHRPLSDIFSQIYSCPHRIEPIKPDSELISS